MVLTYSPIPTYPDCWTSSILNGFSGIWPKCWSRLSCLSVSPSPLTWKQSQMNLGSSSLAGNWGLGHPWFASELLLGPCWFPQVKPLQLSTGIWSIVMLPGSPGAEAESCNREEKSPLCWDRQFPLVIYSDLNITSVRWKECELKHKTGRQEKAEMAVTHPITGSYQPARVPTQTEICQHCSLDKGRY